MGDPVLSIVGSVFDFPNSVFCPWDTTKVLSLINSSRRTIEVSQSPDNITDDNKDISTMVLSAKEGNFSKALKIIKRKPYLINAIPEERAWSVLHQAVYYDDSDVVKQLLDFPNCDPNIRAKRDRSVDGEPGITPLELAKKHKCHCRKLLENAKKKKRVEEATFLESSQDDDFPYKGVPYFDLACSFLKPDVLKKVDLKGCNFIELSEKIYHVLQNDWQYVKQAVAECLYPFDRSAAMDIRRSISGTSMKKNFIKIYTRNNIYRQVNAALRRASNTEFPLGDDLLVSLYTIFLQAILFCWGKLSQETSSTYRGVSLSKKQARKYKVGVTFCWLPFTSSSLDLGVAEDFCNAGQSGEVMAVFKINNKTSSLWSPRDISHLSEYENEEEVMHPSGALFRVTRVKELPEYTKYYISLI